MLNIKMYGLILGSHNKTVFITNKLPENVISLTHCIYKC